MTAAAPRVRLVHWNTAEAVPRIGALRTAGHQVEWEPLTPQVLRSLRRAPPAAVVIDLSRLPMQGRDVGMGLRSAAATRLVPIVFVDGEAEKLARVKRSLPDAVYTTWGRIGASLKRALARPPRDPLVPSSVLAGYSGTPLPRKRGIKLGAVVALEGAPAGFEAALGDLPAEARMTRRGAAPRDLTLWFVRSLADLRKGAGSMARTAGDGKLWIIWAKRTSPLASDVGEADVRREGLAVGLVDYKICAVDQDWSGLLFTRRKQAR